MRFLEGPEKGKLVAGNCIYFCWENKIPCTGTSHKTIEKDPVFIIQRYKIYRKAISTFYMQLIQVVHNINLYIQCKTVEYIQAPSLQILYRTTLKMKIEKINLKERNSNFQIPVKYKTSNSPGWCSSSKILQLSTFSRLY